MEDLKFTKEATSNARQLQSEIQRNIQKAKTIFKNESNITSRKLFKNVIHRKIMCPVLPECL